MDIVMRERFNGSVVLMGDEHFPVLANLLCILNFPGNARIGRRTIKLK